MYLITDKKLTIGYAVSVCIYGALCLLFLFPMEYVMLSDGVEQHLYYGGFIPWYPMESFSAGYIQMLAVILIGIIVIGTVFHVLAGRSFANATRQALYTDCMPQQYYDEMNGIIDRLTKKKLLTEKRKEKLVTGEFRALYCITVYEMGDTQRAAHLMEELLMDKKSLKPVFDLYRVLLSMYLLFYYRSVGNEPAAQSREEELETLFKLHGNKGAKKVRNAYLAYSHLTAAMRAYFDGDCDRALEEISEVQKLLTVNYRIACALCLKALVKQKMGDTQGMKADFEAAQSRAPKIFSVQQTGKLLHTA